MADIANRLPGLLRPDASRTVLRPFIVEDPSTSNCPRTRRVIDRILALDDAGLRDEPQVLATGLEDRGRALTRATTRRWPIRTSSMETSWAIWVMIMLTWSLRATSGDPSYTNAPIVWNH